MRFTDLLEVAKVQEAGTHARLKQCLSKIAACNAALSDIKTVFVGTRQEVWHDAWSVPGGIENQLNWSQRKVASIEAELARERHLLAELRAEATHNLGRRKAIEDLLDREKAKTRKMAEQRMARDRSVGD